VLVLAIQQMGKHTHTPNLAYLDRILQNWMQRGVLAKKPKIYPAKNNVKNDKSDGRFAEYLNNPDYLDENGEPEWNDIYADYFRKAKSGLHPPQENGQ
jgi:DNA replication protein DnaD